MYRMHRILKRTFLAAMILAAPALAQTVSLRPVRSLTFPADVDSNSPAIWNDGQLTIYNSTGMAFKSAGTNQFHLADPTNVTLWASNHRPYWIEATWLDADGTLFAWYHHEPAGLCGDVQLTAPEIGALVSNDGGSSFIDLGIVLNSGYPIDCYAQNGYFAGGHGDFSVIEGKDHKYFYFLFSNYAGPQEAQGVAIARMPAEMRFTPVGAVQKYFQGGWQEPGLGGQVSAIFPVNVVWSQPDADAFWGPSVHWNNYLGKFVMLLNRSCCSPEWPQEGIYVSFAKALADPTGWSQPVKIMDSPPGWYPQVLGLGTQGTDKVAGHVARLYVGGTSQWQIVFDKANPNASADPSSPPQ